ncbi:MAG: class E sortase [Propionibacteriaceae bacterium]|jgi:sortase A|nr:class E sortase [Propionibacteriaceae bacterium]
MAGKSRRAIGDPDDLAELDGVFVDQSAQAFSGARSAAPTSAPAPAPIKGKRKRKVSIFGEIIGFLGEVFVTLGVFLLLFVVWQLWYTDVEADAASAETIKKMEEGINDPRSDWVTPKAKKFGEAFAIIRIPRFGQNYAKPIYEGTDRATLRKGVGHYPLTVDPGEIGNFAVAGHRTTYGKPFNKIAELKDGDKIIIETKETYFVYEIYDHEIVKDEPASGRVVWPVPNDWEAEPTEALLTMTSCHPEFSSRERYVQHGKLVGTYQRAEGKLPPEVFEVQE